MRTEVVQKQNRQSGSKDASLLQKAKQGDSAALAEIYESTYDEVWRTIRSMVKNEDDAADILQDTYLRAFTKLDQVEKPESLRPWLRQIAANTARNQLKKKKPALFSELTNDEDDDRPLEFTEDRLEALPEQQLDRKETQRLVNEMLDSLSDEQRLVIGMYYYQELPVKTIAEQLDIPQNTVKSQLRYGRQKIEKRVRELEKQGVKLYGMTPILFFRWVLKQGSLPTPPAISGLGRQVAKSGVKALETSIRGGSGLQALSVKAVVFRRIAAAAASLLLLCGIMAGGVLLRQITRLEDTIIPTGIPAPLPTEERQAEEPEELRKQATEEPPAEPGENSIEPPTEEPTDAPPPAAEASNDSTASQAEDSSGGYVPGEPTLSGTQGFAESTDTLWGNEVTSTVSDTSTNSDAEIQGEGWVFDPKTGVLRITGNGGMSAFGTGEAYYSFERLHADYPALSDQAQIRTVIVDYGTTVLPNRIFYNLNTLTQASLPQGLHTIGEYAFGNCWSLESITFPWGLTTIKSGAFSFCRSLTEVAIPSDVHRIEASTFYWCTGLTRVSLPNGVTSIGNSAFYQCEKLTSITLPSNLTEIGAEAFCNCKNLRSVTIPASVTALGEHCLGYYCNSNSVDYLKIPGFVIYGYPGTAAEAYAKDNGFAFQSLAP